MYSMCNHKREFCAITFNPIALRMAKTPLSFGHSECSRVKYHSEPLISEPQYSAVVYQSYNELLDTEVYFFHWLSTIYW